MEKEFSGRLEDLDPRKLINKDKKDDFQTFFLTLGLIFNDFKGLILFNNLLKEAYRKPSSSEITVQQGEFSGTEIQLNKLLIALTAEFLDFLRENKTVILSIRFQLLLKNVPPRIKIKWNEIVDAALGRNKNTSFFVKTLIKIRSNVVFHYDHYKNEMRKGFVRSFFKEGKDQVQHQRAYFSLGGTMENTRFFFADAAVQEYILELMNGKNDSEFAAMIKSMNLTIQAVMGTYLRNIRP